MAKPSQNKLSNDDVKCLQQLVVGSVVDLQISTPTAPKRVKTNYIGTEFPHCMLFQVPSESRWGYLKDILVPNVEVVFRFVLEGAEGKVIAFRSAIIKVITHPSNILFVELPKSLQVLALRQHKRLTPGIKATLVTEESHKAFTSDCMIIDVSFQGCRCVLDASPDFPHLENGKTVKIQVGNDQNSQIASVVKNNNIAQSKQFYGIKFSEETENVKKLLNHFIVEL